MLVPRCTCCGCAGRVQRYQPAIYLLFADLMALGVAVLHGRWVARSPESCGSARRFDGQLRERIRAAAFKQNATAHPAFEENKLRLLTTTSPVHHPAQALCSISSGTFHGHTALIFLFDTNNSLVGALSVKCISAWFERAVRRVAVVNRVRLALASSNLPRHEVIRGDGRRSKRKHAQAQVLSQAFLDQQSPASRRGSYARQNACASLRLTSPGW